MHTISPAAKAHLDFLHEDAKKDHLRRPKGSDKETFSPPKPSDYKDFYLPINEGQGRALHELIVQNNCKNIVEFGTSFGISTIYLADAASHTGGSVITSELLESKAKTAQQNFIKAEVDQYIELRVGDAMQTLQNIGIPIDFLFLDGWKDLYLPLFRMLEPTFKSGTLIYADNMDFESTKPYADYLQQNQDTYSTQIVAEGKGFLSVVV